MWVRWCHREKRQSRGVKEWNYESEKHVTCVHKILITCSICGTRIPFSYTHPYALFPVLSFLLCLTKWSGTRVWVTRVLVYSFFLNTNFRRHRKKLALSHKRIWSTQKTIVTLIFLHPQLARSGKNKVFLQDVNLNSAGLYRCEVSTHALLSNVHRLEFEISDEILFDKSSHILINHYKVLWLTHSISFVPISALYELISGSRELHTNWILNIMLNPDWTAVEWCVRFQRMHPHLIPQLWRRRCKSLVRISSNFRSALYKNYLWEAWEEKSSENPRPSCHIHALVNTWYSIPLLILFLHQTLSPHLHLPAPASWISDSIVWRHISSSFSHKHSLFFTCSPSLWTSGG